MSQNDYEIFPLGDWELQSGEKIPNAHIAYKTFGDPQSPAIVYPTWFSGAICDNLWLIGPDKTLNPAHYFIIVPALFGNGQSSSPSNWPDHTRPFPSCSIYDNVRAQHALVTQHLGITHLRAVLGWSMGGVQTYQWATQYPDFMDLVVPFCASARTALHNQVFLEGVKSALLAAKHVPSAGSGRDGVALSNAGSGVGVRAWSEREREVGLKAFGRGYAGWGFSQTFYRQRLYESVLGFQDLEDFMQNYWEKWALSKESPGYAPDLADGDISNQTPYNGDLEKALASIRAKALVLPSQTDLYFTAEDSEYEVSCMQPQVGRMDAFPSVWGHWAGGPGVNKTDVEWLDRQLAQFFAS